MSSRSLTTADAILAEKFLLLQEAFSHRFTPRYLKITCVHREPIEQIALYAQGRETLEIVNAKRAAAELPPITETENQHKVTWTLRSKHTRTPALAIDVVVALDETDITGIVKTRLDFSDIGQYRPLSALCAQFGLLSGGAWGDWAHIELPDQPVIERA